MPPVRMRGDGRKAKDPKKTLLRLLGYLKKHMVTLVIVMACILAGALATTTGSTALGKLVDNYILPMVAAGSTDFDPIFSFLVKIACIFVVGIAAAFLQSYLMVGVTQGIQKTIRDELFTKMQQLPIRYFDSNTAGNIMSRYTSDIDTLRQMVSQSIPQPVKRARQTSRVTHFFTFIQHFMFFCFLTYFVFRYGDSRRIHSHLVFRFPPRRRRSRTFHTEWSGHCPPESGDPIGYGSKAPR